MNYENPTLARLLAKENLTVQHGNYKTAWFDIKDRILGLPMWQDKGKDVYDLLVGHEVGHALYTPFEGWHDSPEKLEGCPRSYINVIEDARIERLIRRDYPGLVGPFSRGYKVLVSDGFFGDLDDIDYAKVKLIDKINLQAKISRDIKVPFNEQERSFYARSLSTENFGEVVQLCRDILAYTKENQAELMEQPPLIPQTPFPGLNEEDEDREPSSGHDDMEPPEFESESSSSSNSEDGDESDDCKETNNTSSESNDDDTPSSDDDSNDSDADGDSDDGEVEKGKKDFQDPEFGKDEDQSITDNAFRKSERDLLELNGSGRQESLSRVNEQAIRASIISFKQLTKERNYQMKVNEWDMTDGIMEGFEQYMAGVKKSSQYAVKEFELHKAAYQWQRAQTSKTGSLDMNKIHGYKFNEDIFARVTQLANSKNHGMIMMIDYSGSMSRTIGTVIDQLMHLVTFCKMVNIPFDVYAFTTRGGHDLPDSVYTRKEINYKDGDINFEDTTLPLLISSSLKKSQYNDALAHLYMKKQCCDNAYGSYNEHYKYGWNDYSFAAPSEHWGSTPLNHALIASHYLIKDFRAKHLVDKMNLIILSDGDSNSLRSCRDENLDHMKLPTSSHHSMSGKSNVIIDGKVLGLTDFNRRATRELTANISKRYGVKTLGFFVSDNNDDWRNKLYEINVEARGHGIDRYDTLLWAKANKEYRKNKCVVKLNTLGYDELYLVKGGSKLSAEEEDFEVRDQATNAQIRNAFKKFSKTKKLNKVLMSTLGKAVA